jgi:hypothetical protein
VGDVADIANLIDIYPLQHDADAERAAAERRSAAHYVASRCGQRAARRWHRPLRHPPVLAEATAEARELLDALGLLDTHLR